MTAKRLKSHSFSRSYRTSCRKGCRLIQFNWSTISEAMECIDKHPEFQGGTDVKITRIETEVIYKG